MRRRTGGRRDTQVAEKDKMRASGEAYRDIARRIQRLKRAVKRRVRKIKDTTINNMLRTEEAESRNFNRVAFKLLISSVNDPSSNAQNRPPFSLKETVDSQAIIHDAHS